jgi:hypothetical protein
LQLAHGRLRQIENIFMTRHAPAAPAKPRLAR